MTGYTPEQIDEMVARCRPTRPRPLKSAEEWEIERREWLDREACESIEAEEALWSARFRGAAKARGGDVIWDEQPGIDRRLFDVSGLRSVRGL